MNSLTAVKYVTCHQSHACRICRYARCKLSSNNKILIVNWFW